MTTHTTRVPAWDVPAIHVEHVAALTELANAAPVAAQ